MDKVEIRRAVMSDAEQLVPIMSSFFAEGIARFGFTYDAEYTRKTIVEFIEKHILFVLDIEGFVAGALAGTVTPWGMDDKTKIYQEVVWYVYPEHRKHGLKLYKTVEQFCRESGIRIMVMAHTASEIGKKMGKFYRWRGFVPLESHYIRRLDDGKHDRN